MKKIEITSKFAHFKVPYATKKQSSYDIPPISTIIGILKVIFGEEIDNFTIGYTFSYESKFKDLQVVPKINVKQLGTVGDLTPVKKVTDVIQKEFLYNCKLIIYTDIELPIAMNYCLNMGKSNCLARINLPIKNIELEDRVGQGYNQYTPINIGYGIIKPITYYTKYNKKLQSYETKIKHLRENKEFEYNKYYDPEEKNNIFLWKYKDGELINEFE